MRKTALVATLALAAGLGACTKTGDGEFQVKTPDVDVNTKTTTVNTPSVEMGSKLDTVNTPVVGTTKDTLIVDRPTAGTKKTEVRVPTMDVKGPNENKRP
jgi:CRISPR/Cas system CMR-associated protein Cmr1 (group 7 of RAMP superfamily)